MKIDRIDISSTAGKATIFRSGVGPGAMDIVINISPLDRPAGRDDSWVVSAASIAGGSRQEGARRLQRLLDDCEGTNSEISEYLQIIETFAD